MTDAKRRGRPSTEASREVCQALLDAAEQCLQDKTYRDITAREVAELADVNPAMINYYFANKQGLFVALIEFLFSEWEARLNQIIRAMPGSSTSPTHALVAAVDDCFFRHAPVIKLLTRELAEPESGIQDAYREKLVSRVAGAISRYLEAAGKTGFYRTDMDPRYAALTLAAMAIHPVSANSGALEKAYGIPLDELRSSQWLAQLEANLDRVFAV